MKRIAFLLLVAALTGTALSAQTPAKPAPKVTASAPATAPASGQDLNIRAYIELLRTDLKKQKAQIVGEVMQLDAQQAAAFWPIYNKFETDYTAIGDQIVELVKTYSDNYDTMTPAIADQLATKLLDIEQERNTLKRSYYGKLKAALDPITATRFLQVENQLEKLVDLQIASGLPVITVSER
jgi:hypothetical protein